MQFNIFNVLYKKGALLFLIGDPKRTVSISDALLDQGILVTAIRPPTVPVNTARLRVTLSASHKEDQVDRLLEALSHLLQRR